MDIMGLALVVVLISLGFLFVLKFNILKKPTDVHKDFTSIELSSNFLSTLLKTTSADCYSLTFTELFQDCGKGPTIFCENSRDSCRYMEDKTELLLNKTLEEWNVKYEFAAYTDPTQPKIFFGGCPGEKRSKFFPLPLGASTMYLRLDIC